jgi:hypothetical protein
MDIFDLLVFYIEHNILEAILLPSSGGTYSVGPNK